MAVTDESRRVLYKAITGQELAADADVRARLEDARRLWREANSPLSAAPTNTVSIWICNDGDYYEYARAKIHSGGLDALKMYLCGAIRYSAHQNVRDVSDDLSVNDLARVDWFSVAEDLIGD